MCGFSASSAQLQESMPISSCSVRVEYVWCTCGRCLCASGREVYKLNASSVQPSAAKPISLCSVRVW